VIPVALTIAGSDPSGGAGLQADLKTFHQHGVYGMSVVTLLTVQNTQGVSAVEVLEPDFVLAQLDTLLGDIPPAAGKTGALGGAAVIAAVAQRTAYFNFPLVVDPVMISKHGHPLIDEEAGELLRSRLLPRAFLVTPNMHEAAALAEMEVTSVTSMQQAAARIGRLGPRYVLVKGGRLADEALDVLWSADGIERFPGPRVESANTHGTGCVFSAAITAWLARGRPLVEAVRRAKAFVAAGIRSNPRLGRGLGPIDMHADVPAV
jgi:hydroxymethylpyrimidine/phosphomethylpyrimidine kinase